MLTPEEREKVAALDERTAKAIDLLLPRLRRCVPGIRHLSVKGRIQTAADHQLANLCVNLAHIMIDSVLIKEALATGVVPPEMLVHLP
jgi:hypothetical protein